MSSVHTLPSLAPPAFRRLANRLGRRALKLAGTLLTFAGTLLGLLFVTFAIGRLLPSDPVLSVVGDRASAELYQKVFLQMGLDRPLLEQFWRYVSDVLGGNFGTSLVTNNPIASDILRFFPATLELATLGMLFGLILGVPLGALCAQREGSWLDHLGRLLSLLGHSVPVFWLGLVALLLFYAKLDWVAGPGRLDVTYQYSIEEVTGLVLLDCLLAGDMAAFANAVAHIVLPATLLGLVALGYIARMTRSFVLAQLQQDYILVLRLKGFSRARILWRYALPNAAGPILAVCVMTYAYLLEGAVLTETVFAWPGLGMFITESLFSADIPAVLAATLVVGVVYLSFNMCADTLLTRLDPRARAL
ncbi:ABC transporter permease [Pseudomonas sp. 5P_3.1_Bac2]|uniref:ABC transporter permease n=1 Tax=Pseudomonas sp. 5P_3.1_Bac2 TaxID=2971617 RepID=UPI0021C69168|nr:ABC transporter permease [Pseudomonas sp. 5P_3.1_Bac2]MCU1716855.1 ABC transporter permease [Pseudomonas sp. 5P_3.1_Bac2]